MSRFETPLKSRSGQTRTPSGARTRSRSRKGAGLASARDRQRVRERNAAERERVERMLAGVPAVEERRARDRAVMPRELVGMQTLLRAVEPPSCPVCCSTKLTADEVMHGGTLRLCECLHCEHRWTERPQKRWAELGATMTRGARSRVAQAVRSAVRESSFA